LVLLLDWNFNYITDTLKGSYYANPIETDVTVPDEEKKQFPEYYGENICEFNLFYLFILLFHYRAKEG